MVKRKTKRKKPLKSKKHLWLSFYHKQMFLGRPPILSKRLATSEYREKRKKGIFE